MFSYSSSRRLWACGFSLLILLLMMISYSEAHVIWEALTTTTTTTTTTKHSHHQPKVTEVHLHYDRKLPSSESASTHLLALSFSLIAGFSTFIGGFIIACIGKPSDSKIGHMMGFASGRFEDLFTEFVMNKSKWMKYILHHTRPNRFGT